LQTFFFYKSFKNYKKRVFFIFYIHHLSLKKEINTPPHTPQHLQHKMNTFRPVSSSISYTETRANPTESSQRATVTYSASFTSRKGEDTCDVKTTRGYKLEKGRGANYEAREDSRSSYDKLPAKHVNMAIGSMMNATMGAMFGMHQASKARVEGAAYVASPSPRPCPAIEQAGNGEAKRHGRAPTHTHARKPG
jgi:hypothetical protein